MPRIVPQNTPLDQFGAAFGQSFVGTGQAHLDRIQQEAYQKARLDLAREGLDLDTKRFEFQAEQVKAQQEADRRVNEFRAGQLGGTQEPEQVSAPDPRLQALQGMASVTDRPTYERLIQEYQEEEDSRIFQGGIARMGQVAIQAVEIGALAPEAGQEIMQDLSMARDPGDLHAIEKRIRAAQDEHAKIQADLEDRQAYGANIDRQIEYMSQDPNGFDGVGVDPRMTQMRQIKHRLLNSRISLDEAYDEIGRIQRGPSGSEPFPIEALQAGDSLPVHDKYQRVAPMQGDLGQASPAPAPEAPQIDSHKKAEWSRGRKWGRLSPEERSGFSERVAEMMLAGASREEVGDYLLSVDTDVESISPPDALAIKRMVEAKLNKMIGADQRPENAPPFGASDIEGILGRARSR